MKQVNEIQMEIMQHALGLNYSDQITRNNYYTDADDEQWNDLVQKGYAVKRRGWEEDTAYFIVTEEGKRLFTEAAS